MVGPGASCLIDCAAPFVRLGNATMGQCPKGNSIPCLGTGDGQFLERKRASKQAFSAVRAPLGPFGNSFSMPRDRMLLWEEPTCVCPEPAAQQGYAKDSEIPFVSSFTSSMVPFSTFLHESH